MRRRWLSLSEPQRATITAQVEATRTAVRLLKEPFELARQAEIVLRDTAYLNAGQVGGWTVLGTLTPGE